MRHRLLGNRAGPALKSPRAAAGEEPRRGLGSDRSRQEPSARRPSASATTSTRSPLFYADHDKVDHRTRVQTYLKAMEAARAALSEGRRGEDRLCDHAQCRGFADRQDLRQPAQGCGDAGADLQAPAAASRRRALPDPPLRLPADRREGARRREAIREDRAGGAARAAHAVAHLHARRLLEGFDRVQLGRRRVSRRRTTRDTTSCMPWTTWSTPICSWRRTRRRGR